MGKEETAILMDLRAARELAKKIFGTTTPTEDMIFNCNDFILCWEDTKSQMQSENEIRKCIEMARDLFGTTAPTSSQVFGIYARMFADEDE